jgi:hypothetical protein
MYRIIFIALFALLSLSLQAQTPVLAPLQDNDAVMRSHFALDNDKTKVSFEVALPNDVRLIVSSYQLSDWEHTDSLPQIINIAVNTIAHITDSFKDAGSTKVVSIHIPIANDPVTVNYKELFMGTTLVISNHAQSPLKIGMDTISILKTYSQKTKKDKSIVLRQMQYLFLVKDIDDLAKLQDEKELLVNVSHTMDSIVHRENKWVHKNFALDFRAQYNPLAVTKKPADKLTVTRPSTNNGVTIGPVSLSFRGGVDLLRNTWMPYFDMGLKYNYESTAKQTGYIVVFTSVTGRYERINATQYQEYGTEFINVGFGTTFTKAIFPLNNLGLSLGYKCFSNDPYTQGKLFRGTFMFGVTPLITIIIGANDDFDKINRSTNLNQSYLDIGAIINIF